MAMTLPREIGPNEHEHQAKSFDSDDPKVKNRVCQNSMQKS